MIKFGAYEFEFHLIKFGVYDASSVLDVALVLGLVLALCFVQQDFHQQTEFNSLLVIL